MGPHYGVLATCASRPEQMLGCLRDGVPLPQMGYGVSLQKFFENFLAKSYPLVLFERQKVGHVQNGTTRKTGTANKVMTIHGLNLAGHRPQLLPLPNNISFICNYTAGYISLFIEICHAGLLKQAQPTSCKICMCDKVSHADYKTISLH